jgi:hypothetical protein
MRQMVKRALLPLFVFGVLTACVEKRPFTQERPIINRSVIENAPLVSERRPPSPEPTPSITERLDATQRELAAQLTWENLILDARSWLARAQNALTNQNNIDLIAFSNRSISSYSAAIDKVICIYRYDDIHRFAFLFEERSRAGHLSSVGYEFLARNSASPHSALSDISSLSALDARAALHGYRFLSDLGLLGTRWRAVADGINAQPQIEISRVETSYDEIARSLAPQMRRLETIRGAIDRREHLALRQCVENARLPEAMRGEVARAEAERERAARAEAERQRAAREAAERRGREERELRQQHFRTF